jgi:hypothetical protein
LKNRGSTMIPCSSLVSPLELTFPCSICHLDLTFPCNVANYISRPVCSEIDPEAPTFSIFLDLYGCAD